MIGDKLTVLESSSWNVDNMGSKLIFDAHFYDVHIVHLTGISATAYIFNFNDIYRMNDLV